jgi:hypothetical protein
MSDFLNDMGIKKKTCKCTEVLEVEHLPYLV